jgi:hypothetical protein
MPIPATSAAQNGQACGSLRNANRGKRKVAQLLELQAALKERALNGETNNKDCAALACAWERLENRLGRLRMRPEPKPVDVSPEAMAGRARRIAGRVTRSGPIELARSEPTPEPVAPAQTGNWASSLSSEAHFSESAGQSSVA